MKVKSFCHPHEQMASIGKNNWHVARLMTLAKDLKVMNIPLDHLNISNNNYKDMTLRELVGHMKSVNDADLKYPIILDEDGEILDGRHRIMKALLTNKKTIKAVRFEENPEPCSIDEE